MTRRYKVGTYKIKIGLKRKIRLKRTNSKGYKNRKQETLLS